MAIQLTPTEIQSLRADAWALKKSLGIKLSKAQDMLAIKLEYQNWALLMKNCNHKNLRQIVLEELQKFVINLSDYEITWLFFNGTVWIYLADVVSGDVSCDSFQRLGVKFDGYTRQLTHGWECIVDLDGAPDGYLLESEVDDEEVEQDERKKDQRPILTIAEARDLIVSVLDQEMDNHFDSILVAVEEAKSEDEPQL
jgi:hypothetical protein